MNPTLNCHRQQSGQHLTPHIYSTSFDTDDLQEPPSLSSSPISQNSALPHSGTDTRSSFSTRGSAHTIAIPRSVGITVDDVGFGTDSHPGMMSIGGWSESGGQLRPNHARRGVAHNRESSLSSLGSTGPMSPYSATASNPRIAIADSGHDGLHGFHDMHADGYGESYYTTVPKPPPMSYAGGPYYARVSTGDGSMGDQEQHGIALPMSPAALARHHADQGGLAPPIDSRRGADSVASSTIGGDSPATPAMGEPGDDRRRPDGFLETNVPKLERTMTETFGDSLFNPNFAVTSSSPSHTHFSPSAPWSRAVEAAKSRYLNLDQSPSTSSGFRGTSPFRNGSPLAPPANANFGPNSHCAPQRGDLYGAGAHGGSPSSGGRGGTPQTISPKDSILEYDDADGDGSPSLFPSQVDDGFGAPAHMMSTSVSQMSRATGGHSQYIAPRPPTDIRVPQMYPFIEALPPSDAVDRQQVQASRTSHGEVGAVTPGQVIDDGGTYSCTYHGCDRRFNTQKELQNHKREGHRASGMSRRGDRRNQDSQQGPHVCVRVNPSTGKLCGSKFSRPYDLTRHEDTIHNARKKKERCDVCVEEKLFSRRDALHRHFKICHEDLFEERFGKASRRRGARK